MVVFWEIKEQRFTLYSLELDTLDLENKNLNQ
jgi:hypothetical protein